MSIGQVYGEFRLGNFVVLLTCVGSDFNLRHVQGSYVHEDRTFSWTTADHFAVQRYAEARFRDAVRAAMEMHAEIKPVVDLDAL